MKLENIPVPGPSKGELLVRTEAIGVNYVDTMRRSGRHPSAPAVPFTPGIEFCGVVVASGPSVTDLTVGQRVIGRCVTHGAYAEYVCVERRFCLPCPEKIPANDAAALFVNPQTAYHALITIGSVRSDETVLIPAAAGGVGVSAVQIAKLRGARVIAAARGHEKLALARDCGADEVVDYSNPDWPQEVLRLTDGQGATLILESVGGDIFSQCLQCWAPGGRMVVFGQASGTPGSLPCNELLFGNRSVFGLAVGAVIEDEPTMRQAMDDILLWYAEGKLKMIVGETHPLSDAAIAHERLEGRQTQGKVILLP